MKFYYKQFKILREIKGYTQEDIAKKLGLTRQALNAWEQGKNKPRPEFMEKLANILECSIGSISDLELPDTDLLYHPYKYSDPELQAELDMNKKYGYNVSQFKRLPEDMQFLLGTAINIYCTVDCHSLKGTSLNLKDRDLNKETIKLAKWLIHLASGDKNKDPEAHESSLNYSSEDKSEIVEAAEKQGHYGNKDKE
jgi:transcriptional regulator with XRE-family HTH domain